MILRKTVRALLVINALQFFAVILLAAVLADDIGRQVNRTVFFAAAGLTGALLVSSLLTLYALYVSSRNQEKSYRESMDNLEELNRRLREQRHDYLNHFQVIYGLLELNEYEEARKYLAPVFREITSMTRALRTSQPAVNALLMAKMESAEQKGIEVRLEVSDPLKKLPLEAWELCKVLSNLIDNAISALGRKEEERKLTVVISMEDGKHVFRVKNNGPEIPEEQRELIFHQGFTTKKEEGHGTGLTIVKEITEQAGGTVSLFSDEKETCFEIRLPEDADSGEKRDVS